MSMNAALGDLRIALPYAHFVDRGTDEYETLNRETYKSALNADFRPACIVLVNNKFEVSAFVNTMNAWIGVTFAIVSRGRQLARGCSNINDGIVLNLSRMSNIEINEGYVEVGAGARWGDVYARLGELMLACNGPLSADAGMGQLLQGGLSLFSSELGFVFDTVIEYEIVLADCNIVRVTADSDHDLWRVLHGGGNNFGIVVSLKLLTFQHVPLYGGITEYEHSSFIGQVEALVDELHRPFSSHKTHLIIAFRYTSKDNKIICMNRLYCTDNVDNPVQLERFKPPNRIPNRTRFKIHTLAEASEELAIGPEQARSASVHTHVDADTNTLLSAAMVFLEAIRPLEGCEEVICEYSLHPYPTSLVRETRARCNLIGLQEANGPMVLIRITIWWNDPEDDEKVLGILKGALHMIEDGARRSGHGRRYRCMSYSADFQRPLHSYPHDEVDELRNMSLAYDPVGLFQVGVPGGWKIPPRVNGVTPY
ncbi:hypothetical protein F4678DRAFT_482939 [Xylaria arbuscula]|nr:hypothetical protein F4678DRAFT_482939 [Xylaria arbuscula]